MMFALDVLGIAGQVIAVGYVLVVALAVLGAAKPFELVLRAICGYELGAAFLVSAIATGGSLFLSKIAGFVTRVATGSVTTKHRVTSYPTSSVIALGKESSGAATANNRTHSSARSLRPEPTDTLCARRLAGGVPAWAFSRALDERSDVGGGQASFRPRKGVHYT